MALPPNMKDMSRAERMRAYALEKKGKFKRSDYLCCQSPSHRCGGGSVHQRKPQGTERRHYPNLRDMVLAILPTYGRQPDLPNGSMGRYKPITKEDVASRLGAHEHEVELVFRQLNREGVLTQPSHECSAHDTRRNPIFPANRSGWAGDAYDLRVDQPDTEKGQ